MKSVTEKAQHSAFGPFRHRVNKAQTHHFTAYIRNVVTYIMFPCYAFPFLFLLVIHNCLLVWIYKHLNSMAYVKITVFY